MSLGLVLGLLALPGSFYSILLFEKYSTLLLWMRGQRNFDPLAAALPDEYFFIVLSMAVTGTVAVWLWDRLFPDRRDYANLMALPVSAKSIFFANLIAILALAVVLALDVNAASVVLFPLAVTASENVLSFFFQFMGIHALVVLLASAFSFFAVLASVGVLMAVLPYGLFRRISLYLRSAIIVALVGMLATSFHLPSYHLRSAPPIWFLDLCRLIHGDTGPPIAALGRLACWGTIGVVVTAIAAFAISYRRSFLRIAETADIGAESGGRWASWIFTLLDRTVLSSPFQRAGYRFVVRTMARSEHHGMVLGAFLGLGVVLASQFLFDALQGRQADASGLPSAGMLAVPLVLAYCTIVGARFVFDVPIEPRANWTFRLAVDKTDHECLPLARKVTLSLVFPWVLVIVLPVYTFVWGWKAGMLHTAVILLGSALLVEILLVRFRKVPFTCSYPPFRDSAVVMVLYYVLGGIAFVSVTSRLEYWALLNPAFLLGFVVIAVGVWYVLSFLREETADIDKHLIFEDDAPAAFELLDLGAGS